MSDRIIYIYTLSDPITKKVRYVGKTIQKPKMRYYKHISSAKLNEKKDYAHCWIRSLLNKNLQPEFNIIEETFDIAREIYWISYYRNSGDKLTNFSDGGELGTIGKTWKVSQDKLWKYKFKNNTPILQYDIYGNFIKRWGVARDFARHYNIAFSNMSSSMCSKSLCHGFILIKDGEELDITLYNPSKKRVKILDILTSKEYIFESACHAGRELKSPNCSISYAARKHKILYKRYKISYI